MAGLATPDRVTRSELLSWAMRGGKDDWGRRAPAMAPMASPPSRPTSKTMVRYPPQRSWNVARNRYQATRSIWLTSRNQRGGGGRDALHAVWRFVGPTCRWVAVRAGLVLTPFGQKVVMVRLETAPG